MQDFTKSLLCKCYLVQWYIFLSRLKCHYISFVYTAHTFHYKLVRLTSFCWNGLFIRIHRNSCRPVQNDFVEKGFMLYVYLKMIYSHNEAFSNTSNFKYQVLLFKLRNISIALSKVRLNHTTFIVVFRYTFESKYNNFRTKLNRKFT